MPTIHFLNVGEGDCTIIQHGSNRITVIDICKGESDLQRLIKEAAEKLFPIKPGSGDYQMREHPTNPVTYMKSLGIKNIFRFILTHPDMDHMDGFNALCDDIGISNFWDSGVRRDKPRFTGQNRFEEKDWDKYVQVREGRASGVTVVNARAGSSFQYANSGDPDERGDCLDILSPNSTLISSANESGKINDASYVIVYRSVGGKIVIPGDAHDKTWEYILEHHEAAVQNCIILLAPHHGRDSECNFDYLKVLKPSLTLFGCAKSGHLAYPAWNNRELLHITNNQAGNIILDATGDGIKVYVENEAFAQTYNAFSFINPLKNGCHFIGTVAKSEGEPS